MAYTQGKSGYIYKATSPITFTQVDDGAGNLDPNFYLEQISTSDKIGVVQDWSTSESTSTVDTSVIGDGMWGSKDKVKYEWSGSLNGLFKNDTNIKLGDELYILFIVETEETTGLDGNTYKKLVSWKYGKAVVSSVETSGSVSDVVKQNFSVDGLEELYTDGGLTFA